MAPEVHPSRAENRPPAGEPEAPPASTPAARSRAGAITRPNQGASPGSAYLVGRYQGPAKPAPLGGHPVTEGELKQRLDAFAQSTMGPYEVQGKTVFAAPHFRMQGGPNGQHEQLTKKLLGALGSAGGKRLAEAAGLATLGKASPAQIRAVTQALIDAGALGAYPHLPPEQAVRRMQWDHGIGLDCSGYVHRALLASRGCREGEGTARYGLGSVERSALHDLAHHAGFERVSPAALRAGDVGVLGGAPGHKVIVYGRYELPAGMDQVDGIKVPASFMHGGRVWSIDVHSSWGAGPQGDFYGGVGRRTWLYHEGTGKWGYFLHDAQGPRQFVKSAADGPYDHPLVGFFRPRGE